MRSCIAGGLPGEIEKAAAARLGATAIGRSGARWLPAMLFERWNESLLCLTTGDPAGACADDRMSTSCG